MARGRRHGYDRASVREPFALRFYDAVHAVPPGLHAVERILYVDTTNARVVDFEKILPGYKAAAFPATEAESNDFKTKLLPKIIADAQT